MKVKLEAHARLTRLFRSALYDRDHELEIHAAESLSRHDSKGLPSRVFLYEDFVLSCFVMPY